MIVVDSSVWIDYFNGRASPSTDHLDVLLPQEPVAIGDIILTEVLQGFRRDSHYRAAKQVFMGLTVLDMLGAARAVKAADRYRRLRSIGVTVTRTTDVIIGSFCIDHDLPLLYDDRGFDAMVQHLRLRPALPRA